MIEILFFIICFMASVIGAICGIGGGVIIKPLLDAFGIYDVTTISFLSGCTVLSMTTYSVIRSKSGGKSQVENRTVLPLAVGAAIGGLLGKELFSYIKSLSGNPDKVGLVQAVCLLVVTVGTLVYTLAKSHIATHKVDSMLAKGIIGTALGIMSSFLGIGGGPINLVVLFFFFSMTTKGAAENSLYIIFFSQLASLISTMVTASVPNIELLILLCMVAGGILGGVCGRSLNRKIKDTTVDKLFISLMVVMIGINIYNIVKFAGM